LKQTAVPLVEAELETPLWYAIEFPVSGEFGIVDFFKDEGGRDKHLNGKVAEALFDNAETLLSRAPEIEKFDVLAAKVSF
jgi:quinol monooxygenase YgiN